MPSPDIAMFLFIYVKEDSMSQKGKVVDLPRRHRRTSGQQIAEWLNALVTPSKCGTGVLTLNAAGDLYEGRYLHDSFVLVVTAGPSSRARRVTQPAFVWVPAGTGALAAYGAAVSALRQKAA